MGDSRELGIPGLYPIPITDEDRNSKGCTVVSKWVEIYEPEPKETSADRDWLLGPSILKNGKSVKRDVHVHFNRCEPVCWWEYAVNNCDDWKPKRTSSLARNEVKAKMLKDSSEYSMENRIEHHAAALARAISLECVFGYRLSNKWPVAWTQEGLCMIYHPPPEGIHEASVQLPVRWHDSDRIVFSREMGMHILLPTWENHLTLGSTRCSTSWRRPCCGRSCLCSSSC